MSWSCCTELVDFYSFLSHLSLTKALLDKLILLLSYFTEEAIRSSSMLSNKNLGAQDLVVTKLHCLILEKWEA